MKRSVFLSKRKIKDEKIKLKNNQLMMAKEIRKMNGTIGTDTSEFFVFQNYVYF